MEKVRLFLNQLNISLGDIKMELFLLALVVVLAGGAYWYYKQNRSFDANKDGKVNFADVKPVAKAVVAEVAEKADVNKDGKVNAADVAEVAKKAKKATKAASPKAKPAAKPKAAKKPKMTVAK